MFPQGRDSRVLIKLVDSKIIPPGLNSQLPLTNCMKSERLLNIILLCLCYWFIKWKINDTHRFNVRIKQMNTFKISKKFIKSTVGF